MVGTGAAAVSDAIALTRHARPGLALPARWYLPPFYYKGVPDDGLVAYIDAVVKRDRRPTRSRFIFITIPAAIRPARGMSALMKPPARCPSRQPHRRAEGFVGRHGLCPGSGQDLEEPGSTCFRRPRPRSAGGPVNGVVCRLHFRHSEPATRICANACLVFWRSGRALTQAVTIRKLFDGKALVSGVKTLLSHIHADPALARVKPPLALFPAADRAFVVAGYDQVRGKKVA